MATAAIYLASESQGLHRLVTPHGNQQVFTTYERLVEYVAWHAELSGTNEFKIVSRPEPVPADATEYERERLALGKLERERVELQAARSVMQGATIRSLLASAGRV